MNHLSFLIKPASSLCNMRCRYCFYADVSSSRAVKSFGLMEPETVRALLGSVFADLDPGGEVTFAFQGGEPTLAGLDFFERFVKAVDQTAQAQHKTVTPHYSIQTNGLALDDAWCAFLARHAFLTGLSLDGDAALHDANRVDAEGKGTYRRVMEAKKRLEKHGVAYNILWVLTNHCARSPQKVWNFLRAQDVRYVQFIPCLDGLDQSGGAGAFVLTPERFSAFYTGLFPLWRAALAKGEYRSVKLFDDLCNLLGQGNVTACGLTGQCQPQFVVEADGSVYPCDFYVLDQWRVGNLCTQTPQALLNSGRMQTFLHAPRGAQGLCAQCEFAPVCRGGCPRMGHVMYENQSKTRCGYQEILAQCGAELQEIGRRLARP